MPENHTIGEALSRLYAAVAHSSDPSNPAVLETLDAVSTAMKELSRAQQNLVTQQALLDDRLVQLEHHSALSVVTRRLGAAVRFLKRAKRTAVERGEGADYPCYVSQESAALPSLEQALATSSQWGRNPKISLLLAARTADSVDSTLKALSAQPYSHWELCIAAHPELVPHLSAAGPVRCVVASSDSVPAAWNAAAALATGDFLCPLPDTGSLSPFALHCVASALQSDLYDVLYCDEDAIDPEGTRSRPLFRPGWSPDLLSCSMYVGSFIVLRRDAFQRGGGFCARYGDACLFDLLLRLADDASLRVHHIPHVLFHRRSDAPSSPSSDAAAQAITDAITRRERIKPTVVPGPAAATFLIRRNRAPAGMTAVICSRSPKLLETCVNSLRATTADSVREIIVVVHEQNGPNPSLHSVIRKAGARAVPYPGAFDFSTMNNLGANAASTPQLLFLNDDVRCTAPRWADLLGDQIARDEIGIAGSILWYPSGVLQHAGIVAGIGDGVGHPGRFMHSSAIWPWLLATRNVSAVTGACLAIRKGVFQELGGFDPLFPRNYNDVDLCFRVRSRGYRIVCVPAPGLIHAECQTRRGIVRFDERYRFYQRWADLLSQPDPFYSPSLAPTEDITLNLSGDPWYRPLLSRP
jgi:O-antigen biosynthesis protein